ncbi:hypothetical protein IC229_25595 [Spirosoma sp. BT702]|uniref:Uncharacterized protein n=1 Tax=Spirosoma profusum TaxID=2771354 RepID=A0A926Y516_9BACT|nr:hypothetical protein [Spirosoma profusum]MBD2704045.1 hypothetical protein [Spirosoma profusum]
MSNITIIPINANGEPISVTLAIPNFPQSIGGVVWRFNADKTFDVKAGLFTTTAGEVPLGAPSVVDDKIFLVEGAVIHHNDNPPTPYQVVVTITQNGKIIHTEVPSENGSGKIGTDNVPFLYRFQLVS